MKKIFSIIALVLFPVVAFPQQLPLTSQYNYDLYQVNPAAAGSMDYMPIALTIRKMWVGVPGSPSIQALSGHMKVADRMGVGTKLFNFMQGPLRNTGMEATYAYHIPLGEGDTKLSFGLSISLYQYYLNKQDLTMEDPSDPALLGGYKKVVPDANFGTLLYGKNYFVGLSIAQLFQGKINQPKSNTICRGAQNKAAAPTAIVPPIKAISKNTSSPANMLPNSRNASERGFDTSSINVITTLKGMKNLPNGWNRNIFVKPQTPLILML